MMSVEQVKQAREIIGTDQPLIFFADAQWLNPRLEGTVLIWDDQNQLIHSAVVNTYRPYQTGYNFACEARSYDTIDTMTNELNMETLEGWLDRLKGKGLIDEKRKQEIIKEFEPLTIEYGLRGKREVYASTSK